MPYSITWFCGSLCTNRTRTCARGRQSHENDLDHERVGCSLSKVNCTCKDSTSATPQTPHLYSTEQRRNPMGRGQRVSKGAGLGTRVQAYVLTIPFGENCGDGQGIHMCGKLPRT